MTFKRFYQVWHLFHHFKLQHAWLYQMIQYELVQCVQTCRILEVAMELRKLRPEKRPFGCFWNKKKKSVPGKSMRTDNYHPWKTYGSVKTKWSYLYAKSTVSNHLHKKNLLELKQAREYLDQILNNVLKLKSNSIILKALTHN